MLSGRVIISDTNVSCCLFFFFFLSFGSYQCTWFSVLPLAFFFFFFPSRTISGDLKRMKETTETKLECIPPYHLLTEDEEQIPRLCTCPCLLPFPLATHPPCTLIATQAKGKMATSPGAMMCGLRGSAVFGEIARLGDYLKVNTIYLHLLSCGLTKGHHC